MPDINIVFPEGFDSLPIAEQLVAYRDLTALVFNKISQRVTAVEPKPVEPDMNLMTGEGMATPHVIVIHNPVRNHTIRVARWVNRHIVQKVWTSAAAAAVDWEEMDNDLEAKQKVLHGGYYVSFPPLDKGLHTRLSTRSLAAA